MFVHWTYLLFHQGCGCWAELEGWPWAQPVASCILHPSSSEYYYYYYYLLQFHRSAGIFFICTQIQIFRFYEYTHTHIHANASAYIHLKEGPLFFCMTSYAFTHNRRRINAHTHLHNFLHISIQLNTATGQGQRSPDWSYFQLGGLWLNKSVFFMYGRVGIFLCFVCVWVTWLKNEWKKSAWKLSVCMKDWHRLM